MTVKDILLKKSVFIQLGTCNADDYFSEMVKAFKPNLVILVEPNRKCIPQIKKCYDGIDNVILKTVAITKEDIREVELSIPSDNKDYCVANYSLVPRNDWGEREDRDIFITKGVNIMTLFKEFNIRHVDLLYMDTEGFDAEIIQSIDFNEVVIDIIVYERWHFPSDDFRVYNKDYANLGSGGLDNAQKYLLQHNYNILSDDDEPLNLIAVLNNIC